MTCARFVPISESRDCAPEPRVPSTESRRFCLLLHGFSVLPSTPERVIDGAFDELMNFPGYFDRRTGKRVIHA